ncbi:MAG TPA: protein translocase subunit SecF [Actinomycetota bacterium]|nr:protein translocase subunit SecF [Actinomycetota bacterium]
MNLRDRFALFRGQREFRLNIIGRRRRWFLFSLALIVLSLAGLFIRQLNLSLEFRGGSQIQFENASGRTIEQFRGVMEELGHENAVVQEVGDDEISIRTEALGNERPQILARLAEEASVPATSLNVTEIGAEWGRQISQKALIALIVFLVLVSIYISFRFEWKMALSALAAMFHDLIITAGVYTVVGREVTPETVIAVLTILGYSLYDTVVIFDKVQENTESMAMVQRDTYAGTVNRSLNQVLMRSLNTSVTVLFPVLALLLFGGETLKDFAFALLVGLGLGAYSSIFIAAPLLAVLKEREPRLAQLRDRAQRASTLKAVEEPEPDGAAEVLEPAAASSSGTAPRRMTTATASQVRPRKPKKKPRSKRKKR